MQQSYRQSHAATTRRGIGPMISGQHPQNSLTPAQLHAQQTQHKQISELAKLRSRKPTDRNIPDGVEECVVGDGVHRYKELRDVERRLDAAMMRKRMDIQDAADRIIKRQRTLRIWISNTVEDQPWQADPLDANTFDFSGNTDGTYTVKIEGRLLDDDDDDAESDSDDEDELDADAMDEDRKDKKPESQGNAKRYRLSHFFKSMTVDYDRSRSKEGAEHSVEWKKPTVSANATVAPNSADFDQLEFKRGGDENVNIVINLTRDENPERFQLSEVLEEIMDTKEASRSEVISGIWQYIQAMGLQEEEEKRSFRTDDRLKQIFGSDTGFVPFIPDRLIPHLSPLAPIKLPYTIRVDSAFHAAPAPSVYDVTVTVPDPLRARLAGIVASAEYPRTLRDIAALNEQLATSVVPAIAHSRAKHAFFAGLSRDPAGFLRRWMSSQKRDLEVMMGEATRGGGEEANGEEWRRGGDAGIWGSENVKESVNLMLSSRGRF